ncbi:binding-protein-dependent transport systems inner membrane component (plasmid) [Haloterrigena turkmenica DSM 5511]|uniref:Binding-protein-dependent transport systems inner membrane component n=1 Tax=Haloterrigena turkmenica (strain ATCC 51198 / DSM 5511 / JCM 9101 / NCIMB 13204 / VKM B-1734 / 4k) TaxID=543526 RepID=D2S240_HALTV|nr:carbohydrate ABC transporter permease [Haloterrigena turkmenica]ADB63437.1 binding-protein-dependent transport systems inner membrane component [Haloterrigena turkmenica DSM 5511]
MLNTLVTRFKTRLDDGMTVRRATFVYSMLLLYYGFLLIPLFWLIRSSVVTDEMLRAREINLVPLAHMTAENYAAVLSNETFRLYFINSTLIAVATTVLTLGVGIPAAYSVSRFDYPGRDYVVLGLISSQMLPLVLVLIPFFTVMFRIGLVDTRVGIVFAHAVGVLPFVVWLLKGYFDAIPQSLDEAAKMDGCGYLEIMYRIIVPLSLPGIAVAAFYAFVGSWNDYLFVSLLSQSTGTRTLPLGLQLFQTAQQVDWGAVTAAAVVTAIPVVVLFALVHKWLVDGLSNTGGKGV